MPKEDGIARKEAPTPVAQVHEHQVSALVPLHVAMGILEAIEHAASNNGDQARAPTRRFTHDSSGTEVIQGGNFAGRKRSTVYPGVTTQGVVDGLTILTYRHP